MKTLKIIGIVLLSVLVVGLSAGLLIKSDSVSNSSKSGGVNVTKFNSAIAEFTEELESQQSAIDELLYDISLQRAAITALQESSDIGEIVISALNVSGAGVDASSGNPWLRLNTTIQQQEVLENLEFDTIKFDVSAVRSTLDLPADVLYLKRNVTNSIQGLTVMQFAVDNAGFDFDHYSTDGTGYVNISKIGNAGVIYDCTATKQLYLTYRNVNATTVESSSTLFYDMYCDIPTQAAVLSNVNDFVYITDEYTKTRIASYKPVLVDNFVYFPVARYHNATDFYYEYFCVRYFDGELKVCGVRFCNFPNYSDIRCIFSE